MTNTVPSVSAPCFVSPGPVQVWVDTGATHAMEFLGYTRGGVRITEQIYTDELKSDAGGGERGPAVDFQFLGETHFVDAELAQFDEAIFQKLADRVNVAATRAKGMLLGCAGGYFRLALISTGFLRNYARAFVVDPIEHGAVGMQTKYPRINFTCLEIPGQANGKPWNTSISVSGSSVT